MLNTIRSTLSSETMSGKLYELVSIIVVEIRYTKPPIWTVSSFYLEASYIGPPQRAPKAAVDCVTISECLWSTGANKSDDAHGPQI